MPERIAVLGLELVVGGGATIGAFLRLGGAQPGQLSCQTQP